MKWLDVRAAWVLTLSFIVLFSSSLCAGTGASSGNFLKISAYSRGMAMGGAWVAAAEGTGALYYNPAGIGRKGAGELSVSHSELLQDLKLENVSVACPFGKGSGVGLGVSYLGYGAIAGYDVSGSSTGDVSAYSLLVVVGFSQRINSNLSLGVAVKPVFERLGGYSARTITTDIGLIADLGQFSLGAQVANWGGEIKFVNDKLSLPTSLRVGLAYRTLGANSVISLGGARDSQGLYALSSGIEYHYNQNLTLRSGYSSTLQNQSNASDGFSFGIGLNMQSIGADYSYRPSGSLDGMHQITASYHFGK
jgi:long-subunit fatty acid transport protein